MKLKLEDKLKIIDWGFYYEVKIRRQVKNNRLV